MEDDDVFEQAAPDLEAMRPFVGKVIAYDHRGAIQESAETWAELVRKLGDRFGKGELCLMYIPTGAVIA